MSAPTKSNQHQLENQCTEVLAWLIDRSDSFARAFCRRFFPEDTVSAAEVIGARTQLSLPPLPETGVLRPDLSVDGSHQSFQLLVEVKVASELGDDYLHGGSALLQHEAYATAWLNADEPSPARARLVGTLTRQGLDAESAAPLIGAHVTWARVREMLDELDREGELHPDVALVARSFAAALDKRVVKPELPPADELQAWLEGRRELVRSVCASLHERIPTASPPGSVRRSETFISSYLPFVASTGDTIALWVFATPAGGACNRPGEPDAVCVAPMRDSNNPVKGALAVMAQAGGFEPGRDFGGWPGPRMYLDLDRIEQLESVEAQASSVADAAIESLTAGGLLSVPDDADSTDLAKPPGVAAVEALTGWEYLGHEDDSR